MTHAASVAVGMEPVAVAARTNGEVWVVNHLSDSVSIVDVAGTPRVVRTLLVGDEPNDIVFAGADGDRAFVTTAHRGQNTPVPDGDYDEPGVGRADVWVFDATNLGGSLGGTPIAIVNLFGDKPRALAVSPDKSTVYAAVFRSGNRTTTIHDAFLCDTSAANVAAEVVEGPCVVDGAAMPGGYPPPHRNQEGLPKVETGLIVKLDRDGGATGSWLDELGRDWSDVVRFDLPDFDVFAIAADGDPPAPTQSFAGVGTLLFNMTTHPASGKLYVANTDARNEVRLEGPGTIAAPLKPPGEPASVRGRLAQARITIVDASAGTVTPRHLNPHLDYESVPQPAAAAPKSLSMPLEMAVGDAGDTLYVAAFGSSAIGVFDVGELEAGTFVPDASKHIALSGGGPAGLVLDGDRLFVLTRFDNSLSVVDLTQGTVGVEKLRLHNPEPLRVREGRPFLYDARLTGSNGEAACASCHPFGDMDDLAWDLGNPDEDSAPNTNPIAAGAATDFHPIKGPMTTQSLRGLRHAGPQHWRGDRQGDAVAAFNAFNVAFASLIGRDEGELAAADMQRFTDFVLEIAYPPNPIRQLDNSLRMREQVGLDLFNGPSSDTTGSCNVCHILRPDRGFFGTDGRSADQITAREFKTPHLRNLYQKIGMFGMARTPRVPASGDYAHQGPQVRGFGFFHDGSFDSVFRFLELNTFDLMPALERDIEAFMLVFDSDLPPMAGQQITKTPAGSAEVDERIDAMIAAAATPYPSKLLGPGAKQCDVIVKGVVAGEQIGGVLAPGGLVQLDDGSAAVSESALRAGAATPGQELTYTCVPFGSGVRMGIDRDRDGHRNRADNCVDVANPTQNDADEDGIGDACEVGATTTTSTTVTTTSTTTSTLAPPPAFVTRKLTIARLDRAPGEQTLKLTSRELDAPALAFAPASDAFVLSFSSAAGGIATVTISPGDAGWRTSADARRFKWRAATVRLDGLRAASLRVRDGFVTIKAAMADATLTAAAGAAEITVSSSAGAHAWSGDTPPCGASASGAKLDCR